MLSSRRNYEESIASGHSLLLHYLKSKKELAMDPMDDRAIREEYGCGAPSSRRNVAVDDAQTDAIEEDRDDGLQEY